MSQPHLAQSYFTHANSLISQHRLEAAIESFNRVIELKPDFIEAYVNRGTALVALGRLGEALSSYDHAIALKPDYGLVYVNRGLVLKKLRRLEEAALSFNHAIAIDPNYAESYFNLGKVQHELKQLEASVKSFNQAIIINPTYAQAFDNLGLVLHELNFSEAAIESYDCAIDSNPDFVQAYVNRGNLLAELHQLDAALESYQQAFAINPDFEYLPGLLLQTKMMLCQWTDFDENTADLVSRIERGEKASPCFPLLYLTTSLRIQRKAAEIFTHNNRPFNNVLGHILKRSQSNKIRIGYFSPDFHLHSVSTLMAEVFEQQDKSRFELIAFSYGTNNRDDVRDRLEKAFDQFIDVRNYSDQDIALLARQIGIDIAVDLGGESIHSRPTVFSYRAAPIQVGYIGYLGTMGADYYDYLIADHVSIPQSIQQFYVEKVVYLPSFQAHDSKWVISEKQFTRQELGLPDEGFIFCCVNFNYKITPDTFDSWMHILKAVKGSSLFLFADNETAKHNLKMEAKNRGVDANRLIFGVRLLPSEYLALYRVADLFLDTFPYNASTTTSDALWAGLPVLTRCGETFASRVAASLLTAIELPELITTTPEDYEALAIELAINPNKLTAVKETLTKNRLTTLLFDTPLFTKHLEKAYTQMIERYQADLLPDHIDVEGSK